MFRRLLLTAALAGATAVMGGFAAPAFAATCAPGADWPAARPATEGEVVALVNAHRRSLGLVELTVSPTLTASGEWKARHMAAYRYMTHDDPAPPVAQTVGERQAACGYPPRAGWGENIAEGQRTAQEVMTAWLNSPPHKANIENPSYRAIGAGNAVASDGRNYWSQEFGTVVDATAPAPQPAPAPSPSPAPSPAPQAPPAPLPPPVSVPPQAQPPAAPLLGTPPPAAAGSAPPAGAPVPAPAAAPLLRAAVRGHVLTLRLATPSAVRVRVRPAGHARRCTPHRCAGARWALRAGTSRRRVPGVARLRPGRYAVTVTATPRGAGPRAVARLRATFGR